MTAEQLTDLASWWLKQKVETNRSFCMDLENCNYCRKKPYCPTCTRWNFEQDQYLAAKREAIKLRRLQTARESEKVEG